MSDIGYRRPKFYNGLVGGSERASTEDTVPPVRTPHLEDPQICEEEMRNDNPGEVYVRDGGDSQDSQRG